MLWSTNQHSPKPDISCNICNDILLLICKRFCGHIQLFHFTANNLLKEKRFVIIRFDLLPTIGRRYVAHRRTCCHIDGTSCHIDGWEINLKIIRRCGNNLMLPQWAGDQFYRDHMNSLIFFNLDGCQYFSSLSHQEWRINGQANMFYHWECFLINTTQFILLVKNYLLKILYV